MEFKNKYNNERDVEIPLFIDFIKKNKDIDKILDVGCARSVYVTQIHEMGKCISCVDFETPKNLIPFLCDFFEGDLLEKSLDTYDLVSAISVVEHYGIKQNPVGNYQDKQIELVKKIGELAKKYIFITFPFGMLNLFPGEYNVIDDVLLAMFEDVLSDFKLEKEFYIRNLTSQTKYWPKMPQAFAFNVEFKSSDRVDCVCILKGVRKDV